MNEKPRQVKRRHVRGLVIFLALFFVFTVFTVFYVIERSKHAAFVYADHLDEAVLTIDGTDVTLREFGYYIHEMEGFVQRQALIYDPDDPKVFRSKTGRAAIYTGILAFAALVMAVFTFLRKR